MLLQPGRRILPLLLALFMLAPAAAYAGHYFRSGVAAFENGNYEQALKYFRQAEDRENQTPNLYYNIGVTCYKTGRYRQAADAFERLLKNPDWRPLALYNLGLTAEAADDKEAAADYYQRARNAADPSSRIKQKTAHKIKNLRPGISRTAERQWYAILSIAAGYDDNAVLAPDEIIEQTGEEEDVFTDLYAAGSTYITGNYNAGIRVDAGAYARFYADQTDYNYATLFADISRKKRFAAWHLSAGFGGDVDFVENQHYATTPKFKFALIRGFESFRIRFDNELGWIAAVTAYDYLSGIQNRATLSVTRGITDGRLTAGYGFEYNDREDLENGDEFFSYSPLRHAFYGELAYQPLPGWNMELRAEYRKSNYADANEQIDNGGIVRKDRDDDRLVLSLRSGYALTGSLELFAEFCRTDNDSNFQDYEYTSNQFILGLEKTL